MFVLCGIQSRDPPRNRLVFGPLRQSVVNIEISIYVLTYANLLFLLQTEIIVYLTGWLPIIPVYINPMPKFELFRSC
jgi:hypothetical protein